MTEDQIPSNALAGVAVRLAAAWLLAGGLFKLLLGTPSDLPPSTRLLDDLVLTYQLYIAIELAVGLLAMLRPKAAWWMIAGAFAVFEVVLATQMAAGAESCGCFGSKVPIQPWQMAAIDGLLLAFVLISRPWRGRVASAPWPAAIALALLGAVAPFVYTREVTEPGPNVVADNGETKSGDEAESDGGDGGLRGFVSFDIEDWVGQSIDETPLAKWIEGGVDALPLDGLWVIWRWTCDHCAKHLEDLAYNPPDAPFITLIQLKEPHDTEANKAVHVMPEGGHVLQATCPDSVDYILTTPGELVLEAGIIVSATEGAGED